MPYFKRFRQNTSIDNIHKFGQYIVIQSENLSKITDCSYYKQQLGFNNSLKGYITQYYRKITIEQNIQFLDWKPLDIEGDLEELSNTVQLDVNTDNN